MQQAQGMEYRDAADAHKVCERCQGHGFLHVCDLCGTQTDAFVDRRSLADLAQEALDVMLSDPQNASNLSGVVLSWGRAIKRLRNLLGREGAATDELNRHPINQLWADKVAHLTRMQGVSYKALAAYEKVYQLARKDAADAVAAAVDYVENPQD